MTKYRMIENIKKSLIPILIAGSSIVGGCKYQSTFIEEKRIGGSDLYTSTDWRAGYTPTYWNIKGIKGRDVPVHEDDSGFLTGSTNVKAKDGVDMLSIYLGLEQKVRKDNVSLTGGVDAAISLSSYERKSGEGEPPGFFGLYDFEQQVSDTRRESSGSFAYDKVSFGWVSPVPFVGLEVKKGDYIIKPELGFPYKELRRETGHHRFNEEDPIVKDSEWKWGINPRISILKKKDDGGGLGVWFSYEKFDSDDIGELEGISGGLFVISRF